MGGQPNQVVTEGPELRLVTISGIDDPANTITPPDGSAP